MEMWIWIVIFAVVIVLVFLLYYNKFVRLNQYIANSFSQINVQLKKRADLVPNLISSVKGYMKHERGVITEITKARTALVSAKTFDKKIKAGDELQSALKSVFAIAEGYPDLKANTNFLQLQQELTAIEDKIAYARQYYNDSILEYNNSTQTIPGKWFAGMYGFGKQKYIEISEAEKKVPKVEF